MTRKPFVRNICLEIWFFKSCQEEDWPLINLVNYVCKAFTSLDYSIDVTTQLEWPPRTAAESILCHFLLNKFEKCTCNIHGSIGERFCKLVVANVFSNIKRKLSTDSAVAMLLKHLKKKNTEKSKLGSVNTLNFYFQ